MATNRSTSSAVVEASSNHRFVLTEGEDRFVLFRLMWVEGASGVFLASLHERSGIVDRRVVASTSQDVIMELADEWRNNVTGFLAFVNPPRKVGQLVEDARWDLEGGRRRMFSAPAFATEWHRDYARVYIWDHEIELLATTQFSCVGEASAAVQRWRSRIPTPISASRSAIKRRLDLSAVRTSGDRSVKARLHGPHPNSSSTPAPSRARPARTSSTSLTDQLAAEDARPSANDSMRKEPSSSGLSAKGKAGPATTPKTLEAPQASGLGAAVEGGASATPTAFPPYLTSAQRRRINNGLFGKFVKWYPGAPRYLEPKVSRKERIALFIAAHPEFQQGSGKKPTSGDGRLGVTGEGEKADRTGQKYDQEVKTSDEEDSNQPSISDRSKGVSSATPQDQTPARVSSSANPGTSAAPQDKVPARASSSPVKGDAEEERTHEEMEEEEYEESVKEGETTVVEIRCGPAPSPIRAPSPTPPSAASSKLPTAEAIPPRQHEDEEAWKRGLRRLLRKLPEEVQRYPSSWWIAQDEDCLLRNVRASLFKQRIEEEKKKAEEEAEWKDLAGEEKERFVDDAVAAVQADIRRVNEVQYSPGTAESALAVDRRRFDIKLRERLAQIKRYMTLREEDYPIEGILAEMEAQDP